jgi:hypothetical protein
METLKITKLVQNRTENRTDFFSHCGGLVGGSKITFCWLLLIADKLKLNW